MKKVMLLTALVVLMAAPSMALIKDSKHNLGITGTGAYRAKGAATSEICIYCHTPHNATEKYPLWNRANGTAAALYSSETMWKKPLASNLVTSLKCLSCHDGTQGLAAGVKQTFGKDLVGTSTKMNALGSGGMASPAFLGTDLSNDHPVGMSYTEAAIPNDPKIRAVGAPAGSGLPAGPVATWFRGTQSIMECASCHDVHYSVANGTKFLRRTNGTSMFCLTCHDK